MRVLFAGTPEVAVPTLQALLASDHQVVGVLTRPDAKAGRGNKLTPSAVRVAAEAAGLAVITGNPSQPEVLQQISDLGAEVAAVVAYGNLLRPSALDLLPRGWFNLHFSLLPRWRGAAPVQWALITGDTQVGVSVFQLDPGMDTGPVYATEQVALLPGDTSGSLLPRLAEVGANLLVQVFDQLAAGTAHGEPQTGTATLAPKITTEQARIDWERGADEIRNLISGVTPAPGAWTNLETPDVAPIRLGLGPVTEVLGDQPTLAPGQLQVSKKTVLVGTGSHPLVLSIVQPPGKKPMPATDWARGARLTTESRLH